MSNMFSNKNRKFVPRTLAECLQEDKTASNLHTWAERLEGWGTALFVILIIIGVFSTTASTVQMIDVDADMVLGTFLSSAGTWALYAFVEYCVYHVLALLISALATITQNTAISANVALYEAVKGSAEHEWTHPIPPDSGNAGTAPIPEQPNVQKQSTPAAVNVWQPVAETSAVVVSETNIKCANCQRVQYKGNNACNRCGAKFVYFETKK